jgi:hypothetical protein
MLRISGRSSGQPQSNHWQKIIENLNVLLKVLQDNHVCISLFDSLFICDSLQLDVCLTIVLFVPRYPRSWLRKFSPRYSHTLMYSYSIGELIFWSFDFCMCGSLCSRWSLFVLQSPPSSWVLLLQQWRVRQGWPSWVGIVVCKGNSWGDMPAVWFRSFFLYMIQITEVSWLQYAASSWDEIRHIRQAVGFLVRCSILSCYMYRISTCASCISVLLSSNNFAICVVGFSKIRNS